MRGKVGKHFHFCSETGFKTVILYQYKKTVGHTDDVTSLYKLYLARQESCQTLCENGSSDSFHPYRLSLTDLYN